MPEQEKAKTETPKVESAKQEKDPKAQSDQPTKESSLPTANNPALSNAPWNKEKPKVNPGRILRIYVVPIVTLVIFFGMIIVLILPSITTIFEKLDLLTTKTEQIATQDETINSLKTLSNNIALVQADLDDLNELVPTGITQVVNFQTKISDLAQSKSLKVNGVTIGEQILKVEDNVSASLGVIEIPSLFSIEGSLANIKDFITALQSINDFVIVGEMKLNAVATEESENTDNWTLDLTLIKYQFQTPDEINQLTAKYAAVPPVTQPDEVVLNYIRLLSAAE